MSSGDFTRCEICNRTLLVGETVSAYLDPRSGQVRTVCPLCLARAELNGWDLVDDVEGHRPSIVGSDQGVDGNRLASRLKLDVERLERELQATRRQIEVAEADVGRRGEREAQLLAELHEALDRVREIESAEEGIRLRLGELERRLDQSQQAQRMLLKARRREADAAYLCGIAASAFNRSPAREKALSLAAELGDPVVQLGVDGIGLPRAVLLTLAWPKGARRYRIRCDLVTRQIDVEDLGSGLDLDDLPVRIIANARMVGGKIELGA